MMQSNQMNDAEFVRQCDELGSKLIEMLLGYPKAVAICALPGVMAAVAESFNIPRETFIAMLDSALEDIRAG